PHSFRHVVFCPDHVPPAPPVTASYALSLHDALPILIDHEGHKRSHRFVRGMMRSVGSLHYAQVQAAVDGAPDEKTAPLLEPVLKDRKSTRLNSSHVKISYAVFCLKKKITGC